MYKLVDVASGDAPSYRAKFSEEKTTYRGRKQVFRLTNSDGSFREDVIARESERYPEAELLLSPVMREGKRLVPSPNLVQTRARARRELSRLPEPCRRLQNPEPYPVRFSRELGLIKRGYPVHLVEDATRHLDSRRGYATIQHVRRHGGRLLTTSEVLAGVLQSAA